MNVVSRAEEKLAGAARSFYGVGLSSERKSQRKKSSSLKKLGHVPNFFKDKIVLDIGSSTGGFTEYALRNGAKKVIAVEKGTNQMAKPLRYDPRVELHEKTDILKFECAPDVILADVSFTSLRPILLHVRDKIATDKTEMLIMLKPQFEAEPRQLVNGVVKNEKMRREIIKKFEQWLKQNGFIIVKKRDNTLAGKNGNVERFYLLKKVKAYA